MGIYTHASEEQKKAPPMRTSAILGLAAPKVATKAKRPSLYALGLKHFKAKKKGA